MKAAINEAVVLMAGAGSRLNSGSVAGLKPLTPVMDRPLVLYILESLKAAGIRTVHAIVGHQRDTLVKSVEALAPAGMNIQFLVNSEWRRQNGVSVLAAETHVKSPFVLTMSDHLFDPELLDVLLRHAQRDKLNLAIDRKIEAIVDIDDAMKIRTSGDRVIAIGKELLEYDAIDTGLFVANDELFTHLRRAVRNGDCSLADGVRSMAAAGKLRIIDVGDAWWQDVDTPRTLVAAENHLRSRLTSSSLAGTGSGTQR
ncbi:MAG: NTP transferase domain-containing protein [Chthoniobacterales bacterium]